MKYKLLLIILLVGILTGCEEPVEYSFEVIDNSNVEKEWSTEVDSKIIDSVENEESIFSLLENGKVIEIDKYGGLIKAESKQIVEKATNYYMTMEVNSDFLVVVPESLIVTIVPLSRKRTVPLCD